jgi:ribosomal protein L34
MVSTLAKKPSKLSPKRDHFRARMSTGCPRSVDKPRVLFLIVGSRDEQDGDGEEGKRVGVVVVD